MYKHLKTLLYFKKQQQITWFLEMQFKNLNVKVETDQTN